jgi:hypothetical protein
MQISRYGLSPAGLWPFVYKLKSIQANSRTGQSHLFNSSTADLIRNIVWQDSLIVQFFELVQYHLMFRV